MVGSLEIPLHRSREHPQPVALVDVDAVENRSGQVPVLRRGPRQSVGASVDQRFECQVECGHSLIERYLE